MLFRQLMKVLQAPPQTAQTPDLRVAVAVLLLEAAHRDDSFGPEERAVIQRLLTEKFELSAAECSELMSASEATSASMVQLHPYTQSIFEHMTPDDRIHLVEMLWEVAYADGVIHPEEDALIRRLGALIYITDRDRVAARLRVQARLAKNTDASGR